MTHRAVIALGLLAVALPPTTPAQENEAETHFREMEKKVNGAKAVRVDSDDKADASGIRLRWTLVFAEGNKCRREVNIAANVPGTKGEVIKDLTISDGTKLFHTLRGVPRPIENAPAELTPTLRASLSRCGMSVQWLTGLDDVKQKLKIDEDFKVTEFAFGGKEKVGENEARVVRYKLALRGKVDLPVRVWFDAKTKLPLKRVTVIPDKGGRMTVTETFTRLTLDPELEPKSFELPRIEPR